MKRFVCKVCGYAYDPEVGENGIGGVAYPKVCVITAGAEFKF